MQPLASYVVAHPASSHRTENSGTPKAADPTSFIYRLADHPRFTNRITPFTRRPLRGRTAESQRMQLETRILIIASELQDQPMRPDSIGDRHERVTIDHSRDVNQFLEMLIIHVPTRCAIVNVRMFVCYFISYFIFYIVSLT